MKKYLVIAVTLILGVSSCDDFLTLQPDYVVNEISYYNTVADFETALIGNYSGLQVLHNNTILYLTELTTDNCNIQWSSPEVSEMECDEINLTSTNGFVNSVWNTCFTTISRCNNILARIDEVEFDESLKSQYKGESLFLRAYCYFYLVRLFGDLPVITVAFRSPNEIAAFDMARKPVSEVYDLIKSDLQTSATLLNSVKGLSKSRASVGAAKTLLGKVFSLKKNLARLQLL